MFMWKMRIFDDQFHKDVTQGNKSSHFQHVRIFETKLDDLLYADDVANKLFKAFVRDRLIESRLGKQGK